MAGLGDDNARFNDDWDALTHLSVRVPDDARELWPDVLAYHREQRARRRRQRLLRLLGVTDRDGRRRPSRSAAVLPVSLLLALTLLAVVALMTTLLPRSQRRPAPLPVATGLRTNGRPGELLPQATLAALDGAPVSLRNIRPAVLVVVPPSCGCAAVLDMLANQAATSQVRLWLAGDPAADPEFATVARRVGGGNVPALVDAAHVLSTAYPPVPAGSTSPTAVLVHADGVVARVVHDVGLQTQLVPMLAGLETAGAPAQMGPLHSAAALPRQAVFAR